MIPFRDHNPSGTTPYVTIALIVLNVLVFLYEASQHPRRREEFVLQWAMQPSEVFRSLKGETSPGQRMPVRPMSAGNHVGRFKSCADANRAGFLAVVLVDRTGHDAFKKQVLHPLLELSDSYHAAVKIQQELD